MELEQQTGCSRKGVEDSVDELIADILQKMLKHLTSERERIQNSGLDEEKIAYRRNPEFDALMNHFLEIPLGDVNLDQETEEKNDKENRKNQESEVFVEEKCRKRRRLDSSRNSRIDYDKMEVLKVFKGNDSFGKKITKPSAIVSLPGSKAQLALLHNDRISVLTSSGHVKATYRIETARKSKLTCWRYLDVDSVTGQLFCVDRGQVKSIEPARLPRHSSLVTAQTRIDPLAMAKSHHRDCSIISPFIPLGLAISHKTRQIFTGVKHGSIGSFSLDNFALKYAVEVEGKTSKALKSPGQYFNPAVVRIQESHPNDLLFYAGDNSETLFSVPLASTDGRLVMSEAKVVTYSFAHHSSIAFDQSGNILMAHRGHHCIEVLDPFGEKSLGRAHAGANYGSFSPCDIAVLEAQEGGDLFEFHGGDVKCSKVVVTPDYAANRVVYFGIPEDVN